MVHLIFVPLILFFFGRVINLRVTFGNWHSKLGIVVTIGDGIIWISNE